MGKWMIDKEFSFAMAHRVWNQVLDPILSNNSPSSCLRIHGHNVIVRLCISSDHLEKAMVIDFNEFKWFKKFIDDVLDHRTILDLNDPLLKLQIPEFDNFKLKKHSEGYFTIDEVFESPYDEFYTSFVLVDFVPTSENFAKWFFDIATEKMKPWNIKVEYVDYLESPSSRARYTE